MELQRQFERRRNVAVPHRRHWPHRHPGRNTNRRLILGLIRGELPKPP